MMRVTLTLHYVRYEQNDFIVDSYEDPFLALENFIPHFYDLLILDINIPKMNGFSFYRDIRKLLTHLDKVMYDGSENYY